MVTNNSDNIPTAASGKYLQGAGVGTAAAFSTATLPSTATGTGTLLRADGTNWVATTATFPNTAGTAGKVLISDGTNFVSSTPTFPNASATSGKFIRSDGTNWIASTPTLPTSAGTSGKVLQSDGTNYIETTATYPASTTINQILYSSSANVVAGLATANSGVLVTSSGGVPSISSTLPTGIVVPAASGSSLVLIQSQTASTSASIIFLSLTSYTDYVLVLRSVQPATNTANLRMLISQDNGSSYVVSGYTSGVNYTAYNSATITNVNSTADTRLSGPLSNAGQYNGWFMLTPTNVGNNMSLSGTATWNDTTLATTAMGSAGGFSPTGVNAIKFQMSSGNIAAGQFTLYGLKTS
jgi:hypothetical protein